MSISTLDYVNKPWAISSLAPRLAYMLKAMTKTSDLNTVVAGEGVSYGFKDRVNCNFSALRDQLRKTFDQLGWSILVLSSLKSLVIQQNQKKEHLLDNQRKNNELNQPAVI